jgi:hypothetical protein
MKMKESGINPLQAMNQAQISQRYTNHLAQAMGATKHAITAQHVFQNQPTGFNPNTHEAWSIPLSQLVNLWQVKFGDTWIDVSDLDDEFWPEASARLHMNNKMEACDNDSTPWARLKEDA